jgi:shikimate kinase
MRNLILTGFMGTGKTTVGRLVADALGRIVDRFIELKIK